jgi:hypothetical protein
MGKPTNRNLAGAYAGGRVRHEQAVALYNANPPRCLQCDAIIPLRPGVRPSVVRSLKFCGKSCAATHNNTKNPKKKRKARTTPSCGPCELCGAAISYRVHSQRGYFMKRRFCDSCAVRIRHHGIVPAEMTKGQLVQRYGHKGAASAIRYHARKVFAASGLPYRCFCGYDLHVELCHVQSIKSFPLNALVSEINALSNLRVLCRNHHWEFDHGVLRLSKST